MFFCKSDSGKGNSQRNIGFAHFGGNIGTHNDKILLPPQLLLRWVMCKKKVWSCSFIDREAFGVARKQINNTPHRIGYIRTIYAYTR